MSRIHIVSPGPDQRIVAALKPNALGVLQHRIAEFQRKTFPGQPITAKLKHLEKEVGEWLADPRDRKEIADCFILLLGAAHVAGVSSLELIAEAHKKMDVNETRKWGAPDEHGVCHHLEETTTAK